MYQSFLKPTPAPLTFPCQPDDPWYFVECDGCGSKLVDADITVGEDINGERVIIAGGMASTPLRKQYRTFKELVVSRELFLVTIFEYSRISAMSIQ